jgi:hypothetical protein
VDLLAAETRFRARGIEVPSNQIQFRKPSIRQRIAGHFRDDEYKNELKKHGKFVQKNIRELIELDNCPRTAESVRQSYEIITYGRDEWSIRRLESRKVCPWWERAMDYWIDL